MIDHSRIYYSAVNLPPSSAPTDDAATDGTLRRTTPRTGPAGTMMLTSNASAFARGDTATINQRSTSAQRACVRRVVEAKESRIGKQPVPVPKGVTYTLKDNHLSVKVCGRATTRRGRRKKKKRRGNE